MNDLEGLVALISGGASGIGAATAMLLQRGARVAVLDRVIDGSPEGVFAVECDITDSDGVERGVASVVGQFGRLDVVVNNAGIGAVGDVRPVRCCGSTAGSRHFGLISGFCAAG